MGNSLYLTSIMQSSQAGYGQLVKMLITLEPHGIFRSDFAYLFILTLYQGRRCVIKSGPAGETIECRRHERGRAREGDCSPSLEGGSGVSR